MELIYSNTQVIEKKIKKIAGPAGPGRVRSPAQITTDPQFLQFLGGVQGGDMGLWGGPGPELSHVKPTRRVLGPS